jgi:hypothetical protein
MMPWPNHRPALDAVMSICFRFGDRWYRASEPERSHQLTRHSKRQLHHESTFHLRFSGFDFLVGRRVRTDLAVSA